jgi:UDP-glucose 4-epimerase
MSSTTTEPRPTILVTGGCGYIGTHTITCLLADNFNVTVVDSLLNSNEVALDAVAKIAGLTDEERKERLVFHKVDVCDEPALRAVFESSPTFQACIHFAGLKVRSRWNHIFLVNCSSFIRI